MTRESRSPSNEPSRFEPTIWTRIERAKGGDPHARDQVYWQYRKPVERFLERRLRRVADVEALADDVMMTVLDPDFLRQVDRSKGRFRDLLLAVTRYRMYNEGRRIANEYKRRVSFDDIQSLPAPSNDEAGDFDRFYADEVFQEALSRFRQEAEERESPEARVVDLYYHSRLTQPEIAERLGKTVAGVNTHLDRGRKRLRKHLRDVLALVSQDAEEGEREIRHVLAILSRKGGRGAGKA